MPQLNLLFPPLACCRHATTSQIVLHLQLSHLVLFIQSSTLPLPHDNFKQLWITRMLHIRSQGEASAISVVWFADVAHQH